VLDDPDATRSRHHCCHRRDVHRVGAVPASADDIQRRPVNTDPTGVRQHRVGKSTHLVDGLSLGSQRHQEPGDLCWAASPLMIWSIAQEDSVVPRSCPASSAVKIVGQDVSLPAGGEAATASRSGCSTQRASSAARPGGLALPPHQPPQWGQGGAEQPGRPETMRPASHPAVDRSAQAPADS